MQAYADDVRRAHGLALRIRVGLNSGEVVVRAIGNDLHMDYSAGNGLHDPPRVWRSSHAWEHPAGGAHPATGGVAADQRLRTCPVKGLTEPAEVCELLGASAVRQRLQATAAPRLTRFGGDNTSWRSLRQALEQAGAGQARWWRRSGRP